MSTNRRLYLQLGRAGDILNALPLAWKYHVTTGERPLFMVAQEFAGILDGVSYVEPVVWQGAFDRAAGALYQARQLTADIVVPQIYGVGLSTTETCTSFARESWFKAGSPDPWGSLPLVIDRRDADRERELIDRVIGKDRPPFVLAALEGTSSPFPYARSLIRRLLGKLMLTRLLVVDLSTVRAERFFDLLGLFERAHCLVAIDTGHQHLAAASKVPVISLATRDPSDWHGSPWRPEHVGRFFYDEFPGAIDEVVEIVCNPQSPGLIPRIIHVWTGAPDREQSADTRRRCATARDSWAIEYDTRRWIPSEFSAERYPRDGRSIGDPAAVPFVRDVIEFGLKRSNVLGDIIALTNADVGFAPGLTGRILETVGRYGSAFTHRYDFPRLSGPLKHDGQLRSGTPYAGTDAFFFTRDWWIKNGHEFGDFLWAREHWDEALRQLIKLTGGREIPLATYHERHDSFWENPEHRSTLAGNQRNQILIGQWFARTGLKPRDFTYWHVNPELVRANS